MSENQSQNSILISLVTISFNAQNSIERTIKSVLAQTYKNIEFINQNINDICASIQKNLIDNLMNKVHLLSVENNLDTIVFGGGVSANSYLKKRLEKYSNENDLKIFIPEIQFSTDNAAMIGIVGYLKYKDSLKSNLKSTPSPRLSF